MTQAYIGAPGASTAFPNGHHANGNGRKPQADLDPPHNIEAELNCLGSILFDPSILPAIAAILKPIDFFRPDYELAYRIILDLHRRGDPVIALAVDEALVKLGWAKAKATLLVNEFLEATPHAENGEFSARIIVAKSKLRLASLAIERLAPKLRDTGSNADESIDSLIASLTEIRARASKDSVTEGVYHGLTDEDMGIVKLESVECRPIRWLWKYRLAIGALAMMAGDGGIGKSLILLWIAARVTIGGKWHGSDDDSPVGDVIIVAAEDRPDDTIKPRLVALGADMSRVTIVKAKVTIRKEGKPPQVHPASFQDLDYWKEVFRRVPGCKLFIVDPLPSYLGRGVNDSKNTEIRSVLEPFLEEIIAPLDICMIGNTHLNKSADAKTPMHRISGSIAYGNLPRNVHFVVRDPEDPERRFLKQAKCNNAPDNLPGLAFRVESREVLNSDGESIETTVPVFEAETVAVDLGEAVNGSKKPPGKRGPKSTVTTAVAEWLFDYLDGQPSPTPLAAVFEAAGDAGHAGERTNEGKWSGVGTIYDAMKVVADLPEPRDGRRIEVCEIQLKPGGRRIKHWELCGGKARSDEVEAPDETLF